MLDSGSGQTMWYCKQTLYANESLKAGDYLCSSSRKSQLLMQTNGVAVIRTRSSSALGHAWDTTLRYFPGSGTTASSNHCLFKNANGYISIYNNCNTGSLRWNNSSGTPAVPNLGASPYLLGTKTSGNRLVIQNDCNLVEYTGTTATTAEWNSKTQAGGTCTNGVGTAITCICN